MKKFVLFFLLLSSNIFSIHHENDKNSCMLVCQALFYAHINLRYKFDADFPKRTSQAIVYGNIPTSFTAEKAYACACCNEYYTKDKPTVGEMIIVTTGDELHAGSITVNFERKDYDSLTEEIYNNKIEHRMKKIESIFDYYNID